MTDDDLRQACEEWFREIDLPSYEWDIESCMRFAKQQQAVGVRMIGKEIGNMAQVMAGNPLLPSRSVSDLSSWCEAKAKELEA